MRISLHLKSHKKPTNYLQEYKAVIHYFKMFHILTMFKRKLMIMTTEFNYQFNYIVSV